MARVSEYVVSEVTDKEPLQHAVIDELEALGFVRIGLLSIRPIDEVSALQKYDGQDVDQALTFLRRGRQALRSSQGDVFAVVDVAEEKAVVSLETLQGDGSLVETFKLPERAAPLPAAAATKMKAFFAKAAAPGRDIDVVHGDLAVAVAAHRGRVHGTPARHDDMAALVRLAEAMLRHEVAVRDRHRQLAKWARWGPWVLALLVGTLVATALGRLGVTGSPSATIVMVFALSLGLSWLLRLVQPRVNAVLLNSPKRRPRFSLHPA